MEHAGLWVLYWVVGMLPFVLVAFAVLWIAYLRYKARLARERVVAEAPAPGAEDPVWELARVNNEIAIELEKSRAVLESTRESVAKGTR
ncbi:MAG: hypothetical protein KY455_02895 [Euryarchaeota archaeon]|nr:hypothetical protein [Euryarchaeota archaeon]